MAIVSLLDRRMYGMGDVDRLLHLKPGTARRWIDGYTRAGHLYWPVIRPEPTGDEVATWGEFTEARLLAEFRATGASLQSLRPAIARLRELWGTQYPLASGRAYLEVQGKELVQNVQDEFAVDASVRIVKRARDGQLLLTPAAEAFQTSTRFGDGGEAISFHPLLSAPDVVVDPERQAGRPIVATIPTSVLAGHFRAGDSVGVIAQAYDVDPDLVQQALRFELSAMPAA